MLAAAVGTTASAQFEGDVVVFGGAGDNQPFEWQEQGEPRGFFVDLARAVADAGGARAEHRLGEQADIAEALEDGEVDAVVMLRSEAREERFLFTPPFYFVTHGLYARSDARSVSSLQDLRGGRVAVAASSFAERQLRSEARQLEPVPAASALDALRAVENGRADYALLADPAAEPLIRERDMALRNVSPPLFARGYAFAVRRDREDLAEWLSGNLDEVLRSGAYQQIRMRWQERLARADGGAGQWQWVLLGALGAVALLGAGWIWRLRRRVAAHSGKLADESERRDAAESRVRWAKDHDVYTDLPRLHHFIERVDGLLAQSDEGTLRGKQLAALKLADLDRTIRALGHDAALGKARDLVRQLLAMGLDAYGQTGRDVFLIFADRSRIERNLRAPLSPTDTLAPGTAEPLLFAGSAAWEGSAGNARELLRRAETALGVAVQRRERWVEYRQSLEPNADDIGLVSLFRESGGEGLYAVFQPQVCLRSGEVIGAEALARWNAPGYGAVSPGRFIPLLEEAGLIRHVTHRMIQEAARVAASLRREGLACPISINVAVSDLLGDGTRRTIFKALRQHEARPQDLQLELTETSFAERAETVRWVMHRLRDSGLRISIDDFGTGFSSLSYLSDFPLDEVKIDRSFIGSLAENSRNRSIVRSTISMAHDLGLLVVAEGVETENAVRLLREDDCDRAQGFLYAKPLEEKDFQRYLADSHERSIRAQRP